MFRRHQEEIGVCDANLFLRGMQSEMRLPRLCFTQTFSFMSDLLMAVITVCLCLWPIYPLPPHTWWPSAIRSFITCSRWKNIHFKFPSKANRLCLALASHRARLLAKRDICHPTFQISLQVGLLTGDHSHVFLLICFQAKAPLDLKKKKKQTNTKLCLKREDKILFLLYYYV